MPSYFCYERDFANRWQAVVYHNGKPPKSVNHSEPERSQFYEVPDDMMSGDSPMFGKLMQKFPAPNN
jgi:hypothetical protein